MALISIDSSVRVAELSKSRAVRDRIAELCVSTRTIFSETHIGEYCNTRYYDVDKYAIAHSRWTTNGWMSDDSTIEQIFFHDPEGVYEPKIDVFLAIFHRLRNAVVGTSSNVYFSHKFRESSDVRVCVAELNYGKVTRDRLDVRMYGNLPENMHAWRESLPFFHDSITATKWNAVLGRSDVTRESMSGFDLSYASPALGVTIVAGEKGWSERSRFDQNCVESLDFDQRPSGMCFDRTKTSNINQCLREFMTGGYFFPRLRKLRIGSHAPCQSLMAFLEDTRATIFPVLDTLSVSSVRPNSIIASSFLKHLSIEDSLLNIHISCPMCESLKFDNSRGATPIVTLGQTTRPKTMMFNSVHLLSCVMFERLVYFATDVTIKRFGTMLKSELDPPMSLPNIKILTIYHFERSPNPTTPMCFFAPNLEEVWTCGKKFTRDDLPRDEHGAYVLPRGG